MRHLKHEPQIEYVLASEHLVVTIRIKRIRREHPQLTIYISKCLSYSNSRSIPKAHSYKKHLQLRGAYIKFYYYTPLEYKKKQKVLRRPRIIYQWTTVNSTLLTYICHQGCDNRCFLASPQKGGENETNGTEIYLHITNQLAQNTFA